MFGESCMGGEEVGIDGDKRVCGRVFVRKERGAEQLCIESWRSMIVKKESGKLQNRV